MKRALAIAFVALALGGQALAQTATYSTYRPVVRTAAITSAQSTSSGTPTDVPGLSVTTSSLPVGARLLITYTGRANKSTAGQAFYYAAVDGSGNTAAQTAVGATGFNMTVAGSVVYTLASAGAKTVTVQFWSSDANSTTLQNGSLIVQELP